MERSLLGTRARRREWQAKRGSSPDGEGAAWVAAEPGTKRSERAVSGSGGAPGSALRAGRRVGRGRGRADCGCLVQVGPDVARPGDAVQHRTHAERRRLDPPIGNLVPGARRRNLCPRSRARTAYALANVALYSLRPMSTKIRPPRSAFRNSSVSWSGWCSTSRPADDVGERCHVPRSPAWPSSGTTTWKPFEPGCLDPGTQAGFGQHVLAPPAPPVAGARGSSALGSRSNTHRSGWYRRGHARGPDVRRDAILVGHPGQRAAVVDQDIPHDATLLGRFDLLPARSGV